jgi:hypothetical protein
MRYGSDDVLVSELVSRLPPGAGTPTLYEAGALKDTLEINRSNADGRARRHLIK